MGTTGDMEESPLPLEFKEALVDANKNNIENEETIHLVGAALIQSLYLSMTAYRQLQSSRKAVYDIQKAVAEKLGLDPNEVHSFDTERNVVIHQKKAKVN